MYGLGLIKGMGVTLKNFVLPSRQFAVQYPDRRIGLLGLAKENHTNVVSFTLSEPAQAIRALIGLASVPVRLPQHSRFRGEEFTFYEQRCTGCASCAKYCPLGIIRIVTDTSGNYEQDGGKYDIEVFDIDIGRCMFCGLCVEACPYDALHMGSGFEEGTYQRSELVIDIDRLKAAPKKPSTWYRPQIERQGFDPRSIEERNYLQVGRHERPTEDEQEDKWANR
jgi:formate hydrogenlyase subunit 6/NADH:ubiquinone oxidoreductase subunit I